MTDADRDAPGRSARATAAVPAGPVAALAARLRAAEAERDRYRMHARALEECHKAAAEECDRLEAAIRKHRDQRADDRCWLDDLELYAALGDGVAADNRVGDKAAMLANCWRFLDRRCAGGGWPSYAELEAERDALRAQVAGHCARIAAAHEVIAKGAERRPPCWHCGAAPHPPGGRRDA